MKRRFQTVLALQASFFNLKSLIAGHLRFVGGPFGYSDSYSLGNKAISAVMGFVEVPARDPLGDEIFNVNTGLPCLHWPRFLPQF